MNDYKRLLDKKELNYYITSIENVLEKNIDSELEI